MRLIDADKMKQQVAAVCASNSYDTSRACALMRLIDMQETAYDVDKVVEQLTVLRDCFQGEDKSAWAVLNNAIHIVKKAGGINE